MPADNVFASFSLKGGLADLALGREIAGAAFVVVASSEEPFLLFTASCMSFLTRERDPVEFEFEDPWVDSFSTCFLSSKADMSMTGTRDVQNVGGLESVRSGMG